jgi:hypothetical protein
MSWLTTFSLITFYTSTPCPFKKLAINMAKVLATLQVDLQACFAVTFLIEMERAF